MLLSYAYKTVIFKDVQNSNKNYLPETFQHLHDFPVK